MKDITKTKKFADAKILIQNYMEGSLAKLKTLSKLSDKSFYDKEMAQLSENGFEVSYSTFDYYKPMGICLRLR